MNKKKWIVIFEDSLKCIATLIITTLLGLLFQKLGFTEANIITLYILCAQVISVITTSWICSLFSSLASVFIFNFLFTAPRYTFLAYDQGYPLTFLVMFIASLLTGTLALQNKKNAREKEQAALLAKNEQLRANLLRSISHDLRTPLTSISGNASNLLSNGAYFDEATKQQLYSDIYDDSMWLIGLVENLLAVTRIEDGKMNLRLSTQLIDEIITESLHHIDRHSKEHQITFHNSDELLLAKVDAKLIMQVIINIVDNAIKYTQKDSHIDIKISKENGFIKVRIADDGPGISDQDKPHVFETFYTCSSSIADSRRSLGLGLSLCRSIIIAHGGEITLSDNIPHGSVFTFTLPAKEVQIHE
ncbi:MAG: ATP-binding protein [Eubacteriales bacterium]|nr:ATP-binding protein [Eubacteriales bacterium]